TRSIPDRGKVGIAKRGAAVGWCRAQNPMVVRFVARLPAARGHRAAPVTVTGGYHTPQWRTRCREPHGVGVARRTVPARRGGDGGGRVGCAAAAHSLGRCSWSAGGHAGGPKAAPRSSSPTAAPRVTTIVS